MNWTLFSYLLRLERPLAAGAPETPRSIRFKKVVTMLVGQVANLSIAAADIYVCWLAASHSALGNSSWSLTLVAVLAGLGGYALDILLLGYRGWSADLFLVLDSRLLSQSLLT